MHASNQEVRENYLTQNYFVNKLIVTRANNEDNYSFCPYFIVGKSEIGIKQ
jgi:hypothetical protein